MSEILLSEMYARSLQNEEPSNYTRIPNILSDLTYDFFDPKTGQTKVKRLSVYAKELYRVLKMTAGDYGASWKSTETLAELCNMSTGMVSEAKKELCQSFHQLEGNSLITITDKKRSVKKDDECIGRYTYHHITIITIWKWNRANEMLKKIAKEGAGSQYESAGGAGSQYESAKEGAGSQYERNKITNNKNPLSKEQQPTAKADSVVFLDKDKVLSPSESDSSIMKWFMRWGCPETTAKQFISKYSMSDLEKAANYVAKIADIKKKKNQIFDNKWGYFRKTLENKYWEKK